MMRALTIWCQSFSFLLMASAAIYNAFRYTQQKRQGASEQINQTNLGIVILFGFVCITLLLSIIQGLGE